ncbi:MAG: isoleucine--tRNA ligase [Oscillospiraceae bacterium]|nr:isoleucine--tRNA ligase [Oscillospiraceae bacterium]
MYKKVPTDLNFVAREKEVENFWKENNIFEKSMERTKEGPTYTFYDGPPTANGKPHIGHVLTRVIKDMIPRYHTMKGEYVPRKAGWDTHGLPVELEVEKKIGINGKDQIEAYGVEPFIKLCKQSVWEYKGMWEDFSGTVGFWADMEHPYVTYENSYIESEWWALKEIWKKGLLYKGFKVVPYCPRCGTPLSSHEVAQGYKTIKERSAIVRFKAKDEDAYYLAWTTTPWTLPSNTALCVNPELDYIKAKAEDGYTYYLAKALADKLLGEGKYEVLEEMKGKALEMREYVPLWNFVTPREKCWFVTCVSYVTAEDGTGIVHIAPAFGEDDANVGRQYNLPLIQLVDSKGQMTKETKWEGMFVKDADPEVLKDLKESGALFAAPKFEHSYPHCWRCDTPLIYYARESWFIKMTAVRDDLVKNNNTINWIPPTIGTGRFGSWIANVQDWGISRNRYWGTPLNIWECECGEKYSVGSIEELKKMSPNCPDDIELHRPYIDNVTITCPHCGKQMHRVPEVIDCWFDSGSMPFAQHHYPFENKDVFERQFPAKFISEAVDQTRGWFYSLLAISTLLFNKAPFENVIVLGHVQDADGQKMSKSKGNAVDPFDALNKLGADAIRWYFYANSAPWLPNRFHDKAVVEYQRKFLGTLWNVYAFFVLYADIDGFDHTKYTLEYDKLSVMDKWILSRLNTTIKVVDKQLSNYEITEASKTLQEFVDDLSNWYVRRSRERFWQKGMEQDKINAYMTLHTVLVTFCKICAPMIPFMTEEIYQNLVRTNDPTAPESIHLCDFPVRDDKMIDKDLESDMQLVLEASTLARSARNAANIKNRQPLSKLYIKAERPLNDYYKAILADELNVKEIDEIDDASGYISYTFKPQLKTLGPKYGKLIGEIRNALANLDGAKAKKELDTDGYVTITVSTGDIQLAAEDLLIETKQTEGFESVSDNNIIVALDTHITPELLEEGFVREIISKLQTMRKEADFNVTDNIKVYITGNDKVAEIAANNRDEIKKNTLAVSIENTAGEGYTKQWDVNGEEVTFTVAKCRLN